MSPKLAAKTARSRSMCSATVVPSSTSKGLIRNGVPSSLAAVNTVSSAGRSLRRRVTAQRQGQFPVLAFGWLDDQEGDALGVQAPEQAQAGVGLPGPGDAGDEQVTGQGRQGHAVGRPARSGLRGGQAAVVTPGRVRHDRAEGQPGARIVAAGHADVEAGDDLNPESRDLHAGQVDVGGELGGAEQRLILKRVPVLRRARLAGIQRERPGGSQLLCLLRGQVHDVNRLRVRGDRPKRRCATRSPAADR